VFHRDWVLTLHQAGKPMQAIAEELGVSRRTVQRVLRRGQNPLTEFCPPPALPNPPAPAPSPASR
jgi:IS30 family transposase